MDTRRNLLNPASLLLDHVDLMTPAGIHGPVLDLACGEGHNGLFLATRGLQVTLCDISKSALEKADHLAKTLGVRVHLWHKDLEKEGTNPLEAKHFGAILVFRYLHRPLVPCIQKALKAKGILFYETFTVDQPRFGRPRNPDFLLRHGELRSWFEDWEIIHSFEGILEDPMRAIARIVCRKLA